MRRSFHFFLLLFFTACAAKPSSPESEILPCYKAKTFDEYDKLSLQRMSHPGRPLVIKGKKYACVENVQRVESNCYVAKSAKEFRKLSQQQEKHHGRPVKVAGKYYLCIQDLR